MPISVEEVLTQLAGSREQMDVGTPPILEMDQVTVNFGGISALNGITASLEVGEVMAVVGPNGAGKTTILNAVNGLIRRNTTGAVRVDGQEVLGRHPVNLAANGIGRSFQNPAMIEDATVIENVLVGAHRHLGYSMLDQVVRRPKVRRMEEAATARAMSVLQFVGADASAHEPVSGLPYGTRKLVDIARALMSAPRLLLLDEPTSGLDSGEQAVVERLLLELKRLTSVSILLVEHHMSVVRRTADRVLGVQAGAVLAVGSPHEVLDSDNFRAAIVGTEQSESTGEDEAQTVTTGER